MDWASHGVVAVVVAVELVVIPMPMSMVVSRCWSIDHADNDVVSTVDAD